MVDNSDTQTFTWSVTRPVYEQVADVIRARIANGTWPIGSKLPGENELAKEFGIARGTLRKSIHVLEDDGAVKRVHGKGTFVTPDAIESKLSSSLVTIAEELHRRHIEFKTHVSEKRIIPASEEIANLLNVPVGAEVFYLERLRDDDRSPIAFLRNWVNVSHPPLKEAFANADPEESTLFGIIERTIGERLAYGKRTISALNVSGQEAEFLQLKEGTAVLYIEQVSYTSGGEPIEHSKIWINPKRMKIDSMVER